MSVPAAIMEAVRSALREIERKHDVRVLYAVESGSRAWGFASADSDYDARFLYVHRPNWYLSIETGRDVIEEMLPGDLDVSGWELRKALRLMRKSNPPFYEWLRSPIVYAEDAAFMHELRAAAKTYYSDQRCFLHYLHMARGNYRDYLQGETVWVKKYLYILRPLLACLWIEAGKGPVPMEFDAVAGGTVSDPDLIGAIEGLLARKRAGAELDRAAPIPEIEKFIARELGRLEGLKIAAGRTPDTAALDVLFRKTIGV